LGGIEIDTPVVHFVSLPVGDDLVDLRNDFFDVITHLGEHMGREIVQSLHVLELGLGLALGDLLEGEALFIALVDDLVVHVGDVHHLEDVVAEPVSHDAPEGVRADVSACMTDVGLVLHGGTAHVPSYHGGVYRVEFFKLVC